MDYEVVRHENEFLKVHVRKPDEKDDILNVKGGTSYLHFHEP